MIIPRRRTISRRTALRGAGVALGLPWLEAMTPAASGASRKGGDPVRLAVLYMPNGINTALWTPEGRGRDYKLSPTLAPLCDLKDQVTVVTNLWNAAANTGDGHYVKESSLLTCTTISKTLGVDVNIHGVSMDQLAAKRVVEQTPLPSLELGTEPEVTGVDTNVGYTRVYGCHISWSSPTTPLAREINPVLYLSDCSRRPARAGVQQTTTCCYSTVCWVRRRRCDPNWVRPTRSVWTSISRLCIRWRGDWSAQVIRSAMPGKRGSR